MSQTTREPLLERGDVLNRKWEILEHIATGGKGEVYRVRQLNLDREVALKIISPELIDAYDGDDEELQTEFERFRREVLAMAKSRHRNVLQVHDFEESSITRGGLEFFLEYIIMEYIPGPTLATTIPDEGLRGRESDLRDWIVRYFMPILDGVEHLHNQSIIHRDLKPANVLLDDDTPKITDFGLVGGKHWDQVTRSHHVLGTLGYMAPEQFMEMADTDFRADVYSLGKILYQALVGTFDKETMLPLKTARLKNPDSPLIKGLDRIIQQATAEDRKQRLPSIKALRERLQGIVTQKIEVPSRQRRAVVGVTVLAVVLAAALAWGIFYHFRSSSTGGPPPLTAVGSDGAGLRLVPAGEVTVDGRSRVVPAFYLDEAEVTNHQYVEFLNAVRSRIRVEDGVVKGEGKPWLLLGEARKGVIPIVFRQGRFQVKDPGLAAHAVLRVTAYGASAYAAHYRRRLPTRAEWVSALRGSKKTKDNPHRRSGERPVRRTHGIDAPLGRQTGPEVNPGQLLRRDPLPTQHLRHPGAGKPRWRVGDRLLRERFTPRNASRFLGDGRRPEVVRRV